MATKPKLGQRRGFTLIATLIVIVLIVAAFFPLLRALSATLFVSADTESTITASNLLQSKMEEIRSLSFSQITSEARSRINNFSNFESQVSVNALKTDLKQVNVAIYWESSGGNEQGISLETYATDY